jgi:hypothetical protein
LAVPLIWTLATEPTLEKVIEGRAGCVAAAADAVSGLLDLDICNENKLREKHKTTRETSDLIEFFRGGEVWKPMKT